MGDDKSITDADALGCSMKSTFLFVLLVLTVVTCPRAIAQQSAPVKEARLTDTNAFPAELHEAIAAVNSAFASQGGKAKEYFASVSRGSNGLIAVYLRHESHDPEKYRGWRGDGCGKCRTTTYDPRTKKVGKFDGIR
jgi:hypothetical protein